MFAKKQVFALFLAWCVMSIAASADTVVLVKRDNAGVYQNRIRKVFETPVFRVTTQDRLLVLETTGDRYLVRNREGQEGWIEKSQCVIASRMAKYVYDPVELEAFHPQVSPAIVFGNDESPDEKLYLNRSFKEELKSNTDKESIERLVAQ